MKAAHALVAWTPAGVSTGWRGAAACGTCYVGPWPDTRDASLAWLCWWPADGSQHCSGQTGLPDSGKPLEFMLALFHRIVLDGVPPAAAHAALLQVDEYHYAFGELVPLPASGSR